MSIQFTFERGGILIADFNKKAPETISAISNALKAPLTSQVFHTRWCGREINFGLTTQNPPQKENYSSVVSKFDLVYWRHWEEPGKLVDGAPGNEALGIYYGAEALRFHQFPIYVNIFGRIRWEYEDLLEEIGVRIWQQGYEDVTAELV